MPADDLAVLKFADYGCEAYGFAVIVNPALAAAKPEAVKGFVRAVIGGLHLTIKDPAGAATEVANRMDGGSKDLELERLQSHPARQHPDQRSETQRHRRDRSGALRTLDRPGRGRFQVSEAAAGLRHFRRPVPAAAQRPFDQLRKSRSLMVRRRVSRASPDDASHRRENHEAPIVPWPILRDAASRLLQRQRQSRCAGMRSVGVRASDQAIGTKFIPLWFSTAIPD